MVLNNGWRAIAWAVALTAGAAGSAAAQVVIESPQSDPRVAITDALESFGVELQAAHDFAVLAADGIVLEQQEEVCMTYLITLWWCDAEGGEEVMRTMRFRMQESCFSSFFPTPASCKDLTCPPGTRRFYDLESGSGLCLGVPANACVHMEVSGPVESSCGSMPGCECLDLEARSCEQAVRCVPVTGAPATVVPSECPVCQ